jgi:hypothetical protein
MRRAFESLTTSPIDTFEEDILTAYLLDPATGLPQQSFDVLHDLLTTRLLSQGRYSNAIDLDGRVTELVRSSDREVVNPRLKRERRQMVDDMVSLLPRVQRDLLAAEKTFKDDAEQDEGKMAWATTSTIRTSVQTHETATAMSVRASKRVVSLSGLIAASPNRSGNTANDLYQAILQNQANTMRALEAHPAPPIPANKAHMAVPAHRSPRPISQQRAQSPFSSPVKLPRNVGSRPNALAASSRPSFRSPLFAPLEPTESQAVASVADGDGDAETTPVPLRRQSPRRAARPIAIERAASMEIDEPVRATEMDADADIRSSRPSSPQPEETPVKPKRARKTHGDLNITQGPSGPRYETRKRQASVVSSREGTAEPTPAVEVPPVPKAAKRTRAKQVPSVEPIVEILTTTPPRRTRKKAASAVPEEPEEPREVDPAPAAKRARRTAATPTQKSAPPPVKRTARQTRSQSVMSDATTEAGDESSQARALRRSGRLSSVVPVSPDKSEAGGVRTRRGASRQPSETPAKAETARPRRAATRK